MKGTSSREASSQASAPAGFASGRATNLSSKFAARVSSFTARDRSAFTTPVQVGLGSSCLNHCCSVRRRAVSKSSLKECSISSSRASGTFSWRPKLYHFFFMSQSSFRRTLNFGQPASSTASDDMTARL